MPRNVRNFWIEVYVDGSKKKIGTGPRRADGGFDLTIYQRSAGDIITALDIIGRVTTDGQITLSIRPEGKDQQTVTTSR